MTITGATKVDLVSPLARAEIVRVLTDETDRWWTFSGSKPFIASVTNDGFSLYVRQWYRNSFRTELRGRFHDDARGTRITGRAGMHPFVVVFMVAWFAIVGVISIGILTTFASEVGDNTLTVASGFFFMLLMGVFGAGLIYFGRWLARDELTRILAFLEEVIDAESVG